MDQGIDDDQQFAHTGGDSDFTRFTISAQALIKRPNHGITTCGGECGHVQRGANLNSPAANGTTAMVFAAVMIERCQARQCRNLMPVELAKFGQMHER